MHEISHRFLQLSHFQKPLLYHRGSHSSTWSMTGCFTRLSVTLLCSLQCCLTVKHCNLLRCQFARRFMRPMLYFTKANDSGDYSIILQQGIILLLLIAQNEHRIVRYIRCCIFGLWFQNSLHFSTCTNGRLLVRTQSRFWA